MKAKLRIQNFRCLEDVTIELRPYTFLFGPNGSGKSTTIKAIAALISDKLWEYNDVQSLNRKIADFKYFFPNEDFQKIKFDLSFDFTQEEWANIFQFHSDVGYKVNKAIHNDSKYYKSGGLRIAAVMNQSIFENNMSILKNRNQTTDGFNLFYNIGSHRYIIENIDTSYVDICEKILVQLSELNDLYLKSKELMEEYRLFMGNKIYQEKFDKSIKKIIRKSYGIAKPFDLNLSVSLLIENGLLKPTLTFESRKLKFSFKIVDSQIIILKVGGREFNQTIHDENNLKLDDILDFTGVLYELIMNSKSKMQYRNVFKYLNYAFLSISISLKILNNLKQNYSKTIRELPFHFFEFYHRDKNNPYVDIIHDLPDQEEVEKILSGEARQSEIVNKYHNYLNTLYTFRNLGFCDYYFKDLHANIGSIKFNKNGQLINLADANSGFQQLFLVVHGILNSNVFYLIEQPELHLHPKLQAQFVDFLFDRNKYSYYNNFKLNTEFSENQIIYGHHPLIGRIFVIETHSEHIIRKVQVLIAEGKASRDDVGVYYFRENDEGKIEATELPLDENGNFLAAWPDGFFDEASNLTFELLKAQLRRVAKE